MLSRLLLLILLFAAAWSTGVMYGAKAMTPHVQTARVEGRGETLVQIVAMCEGQMGFMLDAPDGQRIYLCLRADQGYQIKPEGEPIRPKKYSHPKESQRF